MSHYYSYIKLSEYNKHCHLQQTHLNTYIMPGNHLQKSNQSIGWTFFLFLFFNEDESGSIGRWRGNWRTNKKLRAGSSLRSRAFISLIVLNSLKLQGTHSESVEWAEIEWNIVTTDASEGLAGRV